MMTLTLTPEQQRDLIAMIDLAVKATGLINAAIGLQLAALVRSAEPIEASNPD